MEAKCDQQQRILQNHLRNRNTSTRGLCDVPRIVITSLFQFEPAHRNEVMQMALNVTKTKTQEGEGERAKVERQLQLQWWSMILMMMRPSRPWLMFRGHPF